MKGALIGFGFISEKGHLPAYLESGKQAHGLQIIAVADICEERRSQARQLLPGARVYPDHFSLLAAELERLDFVDIATPPEAHGPIASEAFRRGLHVLCEKPLATRSADAAALLILASQVKRVLFPCHTYKYAPVVRAIGEIIASGQIGRVRAVTLNTFRNTHAKGVLSWKADWRREREISGGGIAMDHGSHSFYLTFDWLGSYPVAVTAKMLNLGSADFDTEDNFSAVLTFPQGLANIYLSWTAGVRKVVYTVQGEKGAITVNDDQLELAVMETPASWRVESRSIASHWMDASHSSWFSALLDQFRNAIEKKDYVGKEARDAYLCTQLIDSAYQSARNGSREISLSNQVPVGGSMFA